jgi:Ca2+-binding RTX toxin-like protein
LVVAFLIGCAVVLLVVGCSGTRSETSKKEQGSSPQATASEEARCEGTRTYHLYMVVYANGQNGPPRTGSEEDMKKADKKAGKKGKTEDLGLYTTNDVPGCLKGGLLLGTDKRDFLRGQQGDDEVRGLGGSDLVEGGPGNDILYGGPGEDSVGGDEGADVIYGGDGDDYLIARGNDGQRDKIYCGEGKDSYLADKNDYVSSSCEKQVEGGGAA